MLNRSILLKNQNQIRHIIIKLNSNLKFTKKHKSQILPHKYNQIKIHSNSKQYTIYLNFLFKHNFQYRSINHPNIVYIKLKNNKYLAQQKMIEQLNQQLKEKFSLKIKSIQQIKNGYNLILLAYKLIYNQDNKTLQQKLIHINPSFKSNPKEFIQQANSKAGNNVILINFLLKHIKADFSLSLPLWVKQLTFFYLLQNQLFLFKFINWMLEVDQSKKHKNRYSLLQMQHNSYNKIQNNIKQANPYQFSSLQNQKDAQNAQINQISTNRFRNIQLENPFSKQLINSLKRQLNLSSVKQFQTKKQNQRFKTQQVDKQPNQLDNLFFASNLKQKIKQNQFITSPQKGDKIVRKGSFKLLKPKANFSQQTQHRDQPKQFIQQQAFTKQFTKFNSIKKFTNTNNISNLTNFQQSFSNTSNAHIVNQPQELKQISMIEPLSYQASHKNIQEKQDCINQKKEQVKNRGSDSTPMSKSFSKEIQNRKTIPKNIGKPPIHRTSLTKNKQNISIVNDLNSIADQKNSSIEQSKRKKQFFNFIPVQNYEGSHIKNLQSVNQFDDSATVNLKFNKNKNSFINETNQQDKYFQDHQCQNLKIEKLQNNLKQQDCRKIINNRRQSSNQKQPNLSTILQLKNHYLKKQVYNLDNQLQKQEQYIKVSAINSKESSSVDKSNISSNRTSTLINEYQKDLDQKNHNNNACNYKIQVVKMQNLYQINHETSISKNTNDLQNFKHKSGKKSQRKVFKVICNKINLQQMKRICKWLKQINQLQNIQICNEEISQIFKNGVKFIEICNRYIGRQKKISFFNNPTKNAHVHANFTKLIDFLKKKSSINQDQPILSLQLFVPYPQQYSIQNMLNLLFNIFKNKNKKDRKDATQNCNLINQKQNQYFYQNDSQLNGRSNNQQQRQLQNKSQSIIKPLSLQQQQNLSLVKLKGTKVNYINQTNKHQFAKKPESIKKHPNYKSTIDFISQVSQTYKHPDLVQNQQPDTNDNQHQANQIKNWINENTFLDGYKQRYLRKTFNNSIKKVKHSSLQTPQKNINLPLMQNDNQLIQNQQVLINQGKKNNIIQNQNHQKRSQNKQNSKTKTKFYINANRNNLLNSSSKKSLQKSINRKESSASKILSSRKNSYQIKQQQQKPQITLNMEMKVTKILKNLNLNSLVSNKNQSFASIQLLNDSIRNGTLINLAMNKIIGKNSEIKYINEPRSIQNCRNNYICFLKYFKDKYGELGQLMYTKFANHIEQIIKGEKSLFYGILYESINILQRQKNSNKQNNNQQNILSNKQSIVCNKQITYRKSQNKYQNALYSTAQNKNYSIKEKQKLGYIVQVFNKNRIQWIRFTERLYPSVSQLKIRDQQALNQFISAGIFLYCFTQNLMIRPVYARPQNLQQKQVNVKKVITYLTQNKLIFTHNQLLNVKSITQLNQNIINFIIEKIILHTLKKSKQINQIYDFLSSKQSKGIKINERQIQKRIFCQNLKQAVPLTKYLNHNNGQLMNQYDIHQNINTTAQHKINNQQNITILQDQAQPEIQIPWLRKLGFNNCSLSIKNGILLCRLISKLTRLNIKFNQNISTNVQLPKAQCLGYIRKALKLIPNCNYDQLDVYEADSRKAFQIFEFIKQKFRNTYELSKILSSK